MMVKYIFMNYQKKQQLNRKKTQLYDDELNNYRNEN